MTLFLKGKRVGSIPAMIFFVIFFTLFSILGSVFLVLETGNPINKVTHSLWGNQSFTEDAGKYAVSKILEKSTGDERKLFLKQSPQISSAVTNLLENPILHQELDKISDVIYSYYANGSKEVTSVDIRPLAHLALDSIETIDPQYKDLRKELDDIKPIKLKMQENGPNVPQIRSYLNLALFLFLVLSCLMLFLFLIFVRSRKDALRWSGLSLLVVGILLSSLFLVAKSLISNQANTSTESLLQSGLPLAAHPLLAPFILVGLFEIFLGLALFIGSYVFPLRATWAISAKSQNK